MVGNRSYCRESYHTLDEANKAIETHNKHPNTTAWLGDTYPQIEKYVVIVSSRQREV